MANTDINLPAQQDLKIEEEGFATPGKAISLPGLSLGIWVATLIIYRILVAMDLCPKYTAFCFFTSLFLSIGGSVFAVSKMKGRISGASKFFLVLMNTFVIYTSSNGIQAGNAYLSKPGEGEVCQKASLVPFLTAASWLPDKGSRETIDEQARNIAALRDSVQDLAQRYNDLLGAGNDSRGMFTTMVYRVDSLQKLLSIAEQKNQLWDALKLQWANAPDRSFDSLYYLYMRKDHGRPGSTKGFVMFLADSTAGDGFYRQMFE
jgi:hypothetical protein